MIVWGGSDSSLANSGGRYRPSMDVWVPTSMGTNVPSGRTLHTAVDGSEMIIWGGSDGGPTSTGGRYNPITDSWAATSTAAGVPTPRQDSVAV